MAVVFTFFETMDELRSVLSSEEVIKFESCWVFLDPNGTGYVGEWKVASLMERSKTFGSYFSHVLLPALRDWVQ